MTNKDAMYDIFEQTDEWNQSSFLKRQDLLEEWETKFHSYYASVVENEHGIYGIYQNISDTRERISQLDTNLQQSISKGSAEIAQTLGKWASDVSSSISSLSSQVSAYSGGGGGYNPSGATNNTTNTTTSTNEVTVIWDNGYSMCSMPVKVKKGGTVTPPNYTRTGYKLTGWSGQGNTYSPGKSIKITTGGTFTAMWAATSTAPTITNNMGNQLTYKKNANGGLVDYTGFGWLDGTPQNPEMVLSALQTKHFINFVDTMDKMYSGVNPAGAGMNSSITIGSIEFQVDSMSSPEDGEKAFNMFVDKFKEIGNQTGIKINSFKNTL